MYQSNRSFNIPPGNPPGNWIFGKFLFKFPPPEAEKLFKCRIIDPFQVIKCTDWMDELTRQTARGSYIRGFKQDGGKCVKWLSNHTPRFLTHKPGLMSYSPTVIIHAVLILASCCLVPINKISVLSSLIINLSVIIQFLKSSTHLLMALITSFWQVVSSGLKLR